jgi:Holliday junction resolvasome RuvABC endonuclease subunit
MAKSLLCLDLGTKTGWALDYTSQCVTSGVQSFQPGRYEGGGMRYLRFRHWLSEMHSLSPGELSIYFEEVRHHSAVDAAHVYGGLLATLTAWCEEQKVPYLGIPVGTIKKAATGKGNASKQQVIEAVRQMGYKPADDNEADALALLHTVREQYG